MDSHNPVLRAMHCWVVAPTSRVIWVVVKVQYLPICSSYSAIAAVWYLERGFRYQLVLLCMLSCA